MTPRSLLYFARRPRRVPVAAVRFERAAWVVALELSHMHQA
jgi:hypothetical protein